MCALIQLRQGCNLLQLQNQYWDSCGSKAGTRIKKKTDNNEGKRRKKR